MLLNAYGWWTVGSYALYAVIGLTVAAGLVLVSLGFELWRWRIAVRTAEARPRRVPGASVGQQAGRSGVAHFTRHDD